MGCSGGLVAEGAGIFTVIWAWLVGGVGCAPGCMVGTVSPVGFPSGTESLSMGLSAGFCLLGQKSTKSVDEYGSHQHGGFILGTGLLLWVNGQFGEHFHGWLVII